MDRDQRELLLCLAYLYLTAGQDTRALALLEVVEHAAPDDPELLRVLGHTLVETDDPARAIEVLDRLERIEGDSPGLLLLRSRALHRLGYREQAQSLFQAYVDSRMDLPAIAMSA